MKSGYKWMRLLRHCAPRNDKSLSSHEYRVSHENQKRYTRIRTGNDGMLELCNIGRLEIKKRQHLQYLLTFLHSSIIPLFQAIQL
ncbi:MAG: hypothetical protein PHX56_08895 [Atribacterota bacterium]|nr:hypothetical protein [Atribacterota bacterium]